MSTLRGDFPPTHHPVVAAVGSADAEVRAMALELLVATYWKPVYTYLRLRWRAEREDAEDLTQEFFARALDRELFARYDPARSRFRTYLRLCLDGLVANERKAARRLKRGGGSLVVSLDFEAAEGELRGRDAPAAEGPEELFRREWVRGLFGAAVDELRARCEAAGKRQHFALFERYDLGDEAARTLTYAQLAAEFGTTVTQVTNHLAFCRREFRAIVLERLRSTSGSDEEFRREVRELLGADPP